MAGWHHSASPEPVAIGSRANARVHKTDSFARRQHLRMVSRSVEFRPDLRVGDGLSLFVAHPAAQGIGDAAGFQYIFGRDEVRLSHIPGGEPRCPTCRPHPYVQPAGIRRIRYIAPALSIRYQIKTLLPLASGDYVDGEARLSGRFAGVRGHHAKAQGAFGRHGAATSWAGALSCGPSGQRCVRSRCDPSHVRSDRRCVGEMAVQKERHRYPGDNRPGSGPPRRRFPARGLPRRPSILHECRDGRGRASRREDS